MRDVNKLCDSCEGGLYHIVLDMEWRKRIHDGFVRFSRKSRWEQGLCNHGIFSSQRLLQTWNWGTYHNLEEGEDKRPNLNSKQTCLLNVRMENAICTIGFQHLLKIFVSTTALNTNIISGLLAEKKPGKTKTSKLAGQAVLRHVGVVAVCNK